MIPEAHARKGRALRGKDLFAETIAFGAEPLFHYAACAYHSQASIWYMPSGCHGPELIARLAPDFAYIQNNNCKMDSQ